MRSPHHRPRASRRLHLSLLCCLAPAAQAAAERVLDFEVLLDGKAIGRHEFRLAEGPGGTEIRSNASFDVRVLGLTVYRYRHSAREQWRAGCLRQIEAETRDGGDLLAVRGSERDGRLQLERPAARVAATACAGSYAYWDLRQLLERRELLNPQTGQFDAVQLEAQGEERIQVQGNARLAQRYRLSGDSLSIDLWYSPEGEWLQLASRARGNRELLYRRR